MFTPVTPWHPSPQESISKRLCEVANVQIQYSLKLRLALHCNPAVTKYSFDRSVAEPETVPPPSTAVDLMLDLTSDLSRGEVSEQLKPR